jgi:hypothetical protein
MLAVCLHVGFRLRHNVQAGEYEAEFPL